MNDSNAAIFFIIGVAIIYLLIVAGVSWLITVALSWRYYIPPHKPLPPPTTDIGCDDTPQAEPRRPLWM